MKIGKKIIKDHYDIFSYLSSPFFIIMGFSLILILFFFFFFDANNLHFVPPFLNDQMGYISVARHLIDYGHFILEGKFQGIGSMVMPGLLNETNSRLYMPGFYIFLSISYWAFGDHSYSFILPSMISYLGTIALIYIVVKKLYDLKTAILSSLIFMFFPFNLLFATLAMSEMTVVFFSFLSFTIVIFLPSKIRPFLIPLLIIIPYLFRQTSCYLLIPILAYLYDEKNINKVWQMLLIVIASAIGCHFVDIWQKNEGLYKISFLKMLINGQWVNYSDAFSDNYIASLPNYLYMICYRLIINIYKFLLEFRFFFIKYQFLIFISILELIFFTFLTFKIAIKDLKNHKWLPISCGILTLAILTSCFFLYQGFLVILLRISLFTLPFVIIQSVRAIIHHRYLAQILVIYLITTCFASALMARSLKYFDVQSHENNKFLESIQPKPDMMLVAPVGLFPEYNYLHYPQLTSFVPQNEKTLFLLNKKFPIGTFVINDTDLAKDFSVKALNSIGLYFAEHQKYQDDYYTVFQKRVESK